MRKIILGAVVLLSLAACNSKSAFQFNQDIVKKESVLEPEITKTEDNVSKYIAAGQYDSIAVAGERMEKLVEKTLTELKAMKAPDAKEGERFKTSAVNTFIVMKNIYNGYKRLGLAGSEEARAQVIGEIQEMVNEKNDVISKMQQAQQDFAKANGFKIKD